MPDSSKRKSPRPHGAELYRHVTCAVDTSMVYALCVALSSLSASRSSTFHVTIGYLEGTLSNDDRRFLDDLMKELGISADFAALPNREVFISQGHISPTTFAKFLLGDAITAEHVWIDADTVALPGWDQLFEEVNTCSQEEGLVVAERGLVAVGAISKPSDLPFNAGVLGWPSGPRRDWETPLSALEKVDTQEQFLFNQLYSATARRVSEKFNLLTYRIDSLDLVDTPYIIHFAGAHKPWHLRRDLTGHCRAHRCPWSAWFSAEQALWAKLANNSLSDELEKRQRAALTSGKVRWRRDHSGYIVLRLLTFLGPVAPVVIGLLRLLKQWLPRGTHPIH
jgi:lipopolysaccharide biosynthesis glycosyltransferase